MKRIGVLLHSLTIEYAISIITGISDFFKDKDVKLIISQVKGPNYDIGLYEYQCWTGTSYLFSEQIDGLIVISGSFSTATGTSDIESCLKQFPEKPIISLSSKLDIPKSSYLHVSTFSAYDYIIKQIKKNTKNPVFAYMTSDKIKSQESTERYDSFIKALENNGFKLDENLLFHGNFTQTSAINELKTRIPKRKDLNFNVLFAANDLMAIGAKTYFEEMGVNIPKEMKIVGFDNTSHAESVIPKIATIDQFFFEQGIIAAEAILKKVNGKNIPEQIKLSAKPVLRESCGYPTTEKKKTRGNQLISNGQLSHFLSKIDTIYNLFDLSKASSTLRHLFYSMPYMMDATGIQSIALCFFDTPIILGKKDHFALPDKMSVRMYIDRQNDIAEYDTSISFNPSEKILPEGILKDEKGKYILQSVFSGEKNYGYIICKIDNDDYGIYPVFLKILINSIAQAFEYTETVTENKHLSEENKELIEHNSSLSEQSRTDELTRIMNRRGFLELGQRSIDMALELNTTGIIMFADMDGLKIINDTYGHKMGDAAIKSMASILTQALRANDVVARLGGDEFACIAVGMDLDHVQNVRAKIQSLCLETIEKHNYPFQLSISIGAIEFNKDSPSIKDLLAEADKLLYDEKKQKHKIKTLE